MSLSACEPVRLLRRSAVHPTTQARPAVAISRSESIVIVVLDSRIQKIAVKSLEVLVSGAKSAVQPEYLDFGIVPDAFRPDLEGSARNLKINHFRPPLRNSARGVEPRPGRSALLRCRRIAGRQCQRSSQKDQKRSTLTPQLPSEFMGRPSALRPTHRDLARAAGTNRPLPGLG